MAEDSKDFFEKCHFVAENLAQNGWCCIKNLFDATALTILAQETLDLWEQKEFRRAGVGPKNYLQYSSKIRGDSVRWLDANHLTEAQGYYWNQLEVIRLELNKHLFLGLFEFEGHLALYPPGASYSKHLDQFHYAKQRIVSSILYLNINWNEENGGPLRLYFPNKPASEYLDIFPFFGTQIFFLSHLFYHEVLRTKLNRLSLTGWFRVRA